MVATLNSSLAAIAQKAVEQGKHVLVEKPMTMNRKRKIDIIIIINTVFSYIMLSTDYRKRGTDRVCGI